MQSSGENHQFASDNTAGICPEVLAALEEANHAAAESYGTDQWTSRVRGLGRDLFETDCDAYLVFNGTASNALALPQLCQPFHSEVCHDHAHIQTDECYAPVFFTCDSKLLLDRSYAGKIHINGMDAVIARQNDVWLRNAKRTNAMAGKLAERLRAAAKIEIMLPVEANALFVRLSEHLTHDLNSRRWLFYKFIEPDVYRLMCSWATTETEIDQFVGDILR